MHKRLTFLLSLLPLIALAGQADDSESFFEQTLAHYQSGVALASGAELLNLIGGTSYRLDSLRDHVMKVRSIDGVAFSPEDGRSDGTLLCGYNTTPLGHLFSEYLNRVQCNIHLRNSPHGHDQLLLAATDFRDIALTKDGETCFSPSSLVQFCLRKTAGNHLFFIQTNSVGKVQLVGRFWRE